MLCRNIGIIQHGELVENTSMKALLAKLKSETFILDLAPKVRYRWLSVSTGRYWKLKCCVKGSAFTQLSEQGKVLRA